MTDRNEPGLAAPTKTPPGVAKYNELRASGFSEGEANQWAARQTKTLEAAGFKPSEVADYWGASDPRSAALSGHVGNNINIYAHDNAKLATDAKSAFAAGWDISVSGLVVNGHAPMTVLPQDAGLLDRIAHGTGQFLGDLPTTAVGFFGGGILGGGGGAAAAAPTGELAAPATVPIGAILGAGTGAAVLPEASRQVLLDSYAAHDGKIKTWGDAMQVGGHSLIETTKAGVIGFVTAPLGGKAGATALKAGFAPVVAGGVDATTQAVTATALGGAMNGHVPDAKDFEAGAILALGFHTAAQAGAGYKSVRRVQSNLETMYRQTGVTPWEALNRAKSDPAFRAELMSQDVNGDPVARNYRANAQGDPEPFSRGHVIEGEVLDPSDARGRTAAPPPKAKPAPAERPEPLKLPGTGALYVKTAPDALKVLVKLEGSSDTDVSAAGAIGKHQIMPGTARQYMGDNFDVRTLHDPAVNQRVAEVIAADLFKRYNGNMNAIAIAYNAGPGRAGDYLKQGPGTRLRAVVDKTLRSGIRYFSEAAPRDEGFLPRETQRYLANMRRRFADKPDLTDEGPNPSKFPAYDRELVANGAEPPAGGGGEGGGGGGGQARLTGPDKDPDFWSKANEESLTEEMLRNVGVQPNAKHVIDPDRILSQFVSELTPARRLDDRLIREGEHDRARDLGAEDMFRQTYGSDSRAGVFVRYGKVDAITLDIKPGSKSMLDAANAVKEDGGNLDGWVAFMLAKRTTEKEAQGVKTGFNPRAARALAENKKAVKKYQRATDVFQEVVNGALEYSRDSGVHSQAQVDAMIRDNPTYVSMRRIMGDDETFAASGRGFRPRDSLKRMEGSDRQIVDPVVASMDNIRLLVKMADRNRAIGHVVGMAERGELAGLDIRKIEDQQTIKAADEKVFKPYGIPAEADPNSTYAPFLAEKNARGSHGPNDFLFFRDGKAERWTTSDPQLAELLRKADSPGQANIVVSTFQTFAKVQRAGIVAAPDFPLRNVLRDQLQAFVMDPLHPPPFVTWLSGIAHVLKQDAVFQDAVAKGALGSALVDMDTNWLAKDMDAVFTSTNTWDAVVNNVKHPLGFMQIISERIDAASRVGYFKHAQAQGVQPIKAATMSRKAYLDFAERGTAQIADTMAKITPFFRPSLLGLKQFGEAMKERPGSTLAYAAATIAVPMVALYILNYFQDQSLPDGEKYADLPRWQRDHYFISPDIAGTRFRLRLPQQVGFVFGGMTNRMLDTFVQHDKHAFEKWAQGFMSDYLPPMFPALVQTPLEVASNHSFFTGRSLIPGSLEKASGYMQYTPATSETGKALSRFLGEPGVDIMEFSPIQFDHFVQGWSGTLGSTLLKTLDIPFKQEGKPWEVADIPFVGSFVVRNPGMSAEPIQKFYDGMADLEKKSNDFSLAMRRAEGGQPQEVEETAEGSQYAQAVLPIKQAIQVQAAAIQGINANQEMTADEKRQAIDALYPMMVQTAKRGLETIDTLKAPIPETEALPTPPPVQGGPAAPAAAPAPVPGANRGIVPVA